MASLEGNNIVIHDITISDSAHLKSGLIREVTFNGTGLIRHVAFDGSGPIRGGTLTGVSL